MSAWLPAAMSVLPVTLFWSHTSLLMGFCVAFAVSYRQFCWAIVDFRPPQWLMRRIPLPASDVVDIEA